MVYEQHNKLEEEISILKLTFFTNFAFIFTLVVFFQKIRCMRGDDLAFAMKLKVLESKNNLSGKIASQLHKKMKHSGVSDDHKSKSPLFSPLLG